MDNPDIHDKFNLVNKSYLPFRYLNRGMFSSHDKDYASTIFGGRRDDDNLYVPGKCSEVKPLSLCLNFCLAPPSDPPPWNDPEHSWRYVGDMVYTGEGFVYAPRPTHIRNANIPPRTSRIPRGIQSVRPMPQNFATTFPQRSDQPISTATYSQNDSPKLPQTNHASLSKIKSGKRAGTSLSSTPARAASHSPLPQGPTEWNSANILKLYKWKTIKKKGNKFVSQVFPGETEESISAAWRMYRGEGGRLMEAELADRV